jgi:hypothetical protein
VSNDNTQKKKRKTVDDCFAMIKEQDMKMPNDRKQLHGGALLVKWVSVSICPFKTVEDEGLQEFVAYLCRLKKKEFFHHI